MKIENWKLKIYLVLLILAFAVFPKKAWAGNLSLGIYPPIIQIESMPPASIKTPITVQNLGEETLELKAVFKPFKAKDTENGEVEHINDYPFIFQQMQLFDDLKVVDSLTLAPSQEKTLDFHIGISKDEPAQDYYFSILFMSKDNITTDSNNSSAVGGIGTNVLLSIGPKGKAKGTIEEFSAPLFLEKGPVPFIVRVKNEGENVFAPKGFILIKNVFGQTIGKVDLLPVNILSNSIRAIPDSNQYKSEARNSKLETNSNDKNTKNKNAPGFENSNFDIVSDFDIRYSNLEKPVALWPESFLLGPYTATLTLSLSDQGPQLNRSVYFFAFPIQGLIGLGIALIIILIIRNRVKKQLE